MEALLVCRALLVCAGVVLLLPVLVFSVEVACSFLPFPEDERKYEEDAAPSVAVVVPAHNEATTIDGTVRCILEQLATGDRLLVVADNCQDDTAKLAAQAGADVVIRKDPGLRGKGYALNFGISCLAQAPPSVVIVVDADCRLTAQTIAILSRTCAITRRPVQSLYLMLAPANAGPLRRLAQFAWDIRNRVRPLGLRRLRLPCQLMGSGMAFPWELVGHGQFASGHLVEDLELGMKLAASGRGPIFCPEAVVTSVFPTSAAGVTSQRTRWEHGHLSLMLRHVPRLLLVAIFRGQVGAMALAIDLLVPPLALLVLLAVLIWSFSLIIALMSGYLLPLSLSSLDLLMLVLAGLSAWVRFGRRIVSFVDLLGAFAYVIKKIPLYLRFVVARQISWVRSDRDGQEPPAG